MSSRENADIVREAVTLAFDAPSEAHAALDALLEEVERLRQHQVDACAATDPSSRPDITDDFREAMLAATMNRRDCDRAEAEVILDRIADRLDGMTHDEVVQLHPLPQKEEDVTS